MNTNVTIHPQVLFNISSHFITNKINSQNPQDKYYGILLGTYNNRQQTIDIVDSFEGQYESQDYQLNNKEVEFLKERLELRDRGDQWNLFKELTIVGWYLTVEGVPQNEYLKLHSQIRNIVDEYVQENQVNVFRYLLCFNSHQKVFHENNLRIYQEQQEKDKQYFVNVNYKIEPSQQEMITINSAQGNQQIQNDSSLITRLDQQYQTIMTFQQLLKKILNSLDNPKVRQNPILLREINQVLNNYPKLTNDTLDQKIISEFAKIQLLSFYCILLSFEKASKDIQGEYEGINLHLKMH